MPVWHLRPTIGKSCPLNSFFFFNLKYLISYCFVLHQVLVAARGIFTAVYRLFIVEQGLLSSCGPRVPGYVGSVVAPQQCGILVPRPGMEPLSPAL